MKSFLQKNSSIILIVFIGAFLRFFNPLWDNGLFLHPDERLFVNASNLSLPKTLAEFFSPASPLNPHMFYYGSLLLYIYKLLSLISPFTFLETSRLFSAFLSALTIGVVFVIGKELFSKKVGIFSSIVFALAAGSIQYAHFNTTESSLMFFITLITLIDILAVKRKKPHLLFISLFFVGLSGAIKITGLTFGISSFLAFALLIKEKLTWKKTIISFIGGCCIAGLTYILLSPYQFIDWHEFTQQQTYMQAVTYGVFKPPFVMIYENTPSYLYQIFHVFPFIFGFISFPLSLIGFCFLAQKIVQKWKTELLLFFLFAFPLAYFAWSGNWFAKYARYYLLLIPFMSLWAGYILEKIPKNLRLILLLFIIVNGLLFTRIYFSDNTRVTASKWIYSTIPQGSTIATEHWDDALPLSFPAIKQSPTYTVISLPVYNGENTGKITTIATLVAQSNYIILSSRRVYVSILQNPIKYPETNTFYYKLFANKLGFQKIYEKTNYPFFFSDDYADETFQSYDHPPVMVFANTKHYSKEKILSELTTP